MINRYHGKCDACTAEFVFRAVVPLATTDGFRFCCPSCNVELVALLKLDYDSHRMNLDAKGFHLSVATDTDVPADVVTVATDLPVHRTRHVNPMDDGGSPYLLLHQEMGAAFLKWTEKIQALQVLRHTQFETARQLVNFVRGGNWSMATEHLKDVFDPAPKEAHQIIHAAYRTMGVLYASLLTDPPMFDYLDEYYGYLNDCMKQKRPEYQTLLTDWSTSPLYRGFRTKALASFLRVLAHFDAFIVGLLYNEMPTKLRDDINSYRIFRDDYSVVKGLYQDLFELTSQLLILWVTSSTSLSVAMLATISLALRQQRRSSSRLRSNASRSCWNSRRFLIYWAA